MPVPGGLAKGHGGEDVERIGDNWVKTFERVGGLTGSDRVLDIGCGPGRMASSIGRRFGWTNRLTGFDIRAKDIAFCRTEITARHPGFDFVHCDVLNHLYNRNGTIDPARLGFPVAAGSIDFAFATSVFTHMFRDQVDHYIAETARALRPGGTFLSTWLLIDDDAPPPPDPIFVFAHERPDGTFVQNPDRPEEGVAYRRSAALDLIEQRGFTGVFHYPGGWRRVTRCRHNQDVIVAARP